MATPFKMKGSPMKRNFGIGSPVKKDMNLSPELLKLKKERVAASNAGKIIKFGEGSNIIPDADDTVSRNFNTKGSKSTVGKTPGYSTTKAAKKAAKAVKKGARAIGGKALGVLGLMSAGTLSATATPKGKAKKKGSYTSDIQNIIPKSKKKSIWDNKKQIVKR
tara:strand:+ start:71 stop:559 length:489 start_codon:yes stop_codon:yes gene_type:complete